MPLDVIAIVVVEGAGTGAGDGEGEGAGDGDGAGAGAVVGEGDDTLLLEPHAVATRPVNNITGSESVFRTQ